MTSPATFAATARELVGFPIPAGCAGPIEILVDDDCQSRMATVFARQIAFICMPCHTLGDMRGFDYVP